MADEAPQTIGEAMGKPSDTTELEALLGVDVEIPVPAYPESLQSRDYS